MSRSSTPNRNAKHEGRARRKRWRALLFIAAFLSEAIPVWRRGHRLGGNVVVRCRDGHLFTTIWIPGASVKSVRLGPWRVQRCPVGNHWTLVTPVDKRDLTEDEARAAGEQRDIRVP
jgi:hypothetical protein